MVLNNRYLGSDEAIYLQQKAGNSLFESALSAANKINESTQNYLDSALKINERFMQLSQQNEAAKAVLGSAQPGLAVLADAGLKYMALKQQHEQELAKISLQLKQQQLKKLLDSNYEQATSRIGQLMQDYIESGALFRETQTDKGVVTGPQSFRESALRELTNVGELDPDDKVKLLNKINEFAESASRERQRKLIDALEKNKAARADAIVAGLELDVVPLISNIKKAGVTQQAKPWLDAISQRLKDFLAADNGLEEHEKLTAAARVLRQAADAYGVKVENYAQYNADLVNFQNFVQEYYKARMEYVSPASKDYNNYDVFKTKVGLAAIKYGDWTKNVAQINEADKLKMEAIELQRAQQRVQEEVVKSAGMRFPFSNAWSVWVAASAISNPFFAASIQNSEFGDNPATKNGLWLAEEYKKYEKDLTALQTELAGLNIDFYRMDLRRVDSMSAVLNKLAERNTTGQLSPADLEFLNQLQQNAPELYGILASKLTNPQQSLDVGALRRALDLEQNAITRIQNAIIDKQRTKQAELRARYAHLAQAGLLVDRTQIAKIAQQYKAAAEKELSEANKFANELKARVVVPQFYGVPPNFDGSSTYAPDVDASGRVRVAPRARLQNLRVGNNTIITPVLAGANAPITSQFGAPRPSNRRHAGVDFGVEGNERAVALVGGVAYVGKADGYGNFIDIIGDNGFVYRYAHQQALVKSGQRVQPGEPISFSDGSGINIGGKHLHFEVRNKANFDSKGNYVPSFGWDGVVDPIEHLRRLTIKDSNVLKPRSIGALFARTHPWLKASPNSFLTPQGAMQANVFQTPTSQPQPATNVFTAQRPLNRTYLPFTRGNVQSYDYNDDYNYAILRKNPTWRRALVDAARALKIPAVWLADIIQQETSWNIHKRHGGRITGIIGFDDPTAGDKPFETQAKMVVDYYRKAGWFDVLRKKGPNASIADFWILTRAGTVPLRSLGGKNMRQYIIDGGDPFKLRMNDTGTTFGYELQLLGKWAGRRYNIPYSGGVNSNYRISRNKAVSFDYHPHCSICNELLLSGSWVHHQHDNTI